MFRHFQPPRRSAVAAALRRPAVAILATFALGLAHASAYEIQVRNLNALGNGAVSPGVGASSATAGPVNNPLFPSNPFPASVVPGSDPAAPKIFLPSATFGAPVSSGVPRYSLGEIISPPLTDSSENPVDPSYWRSKPLQPGETILPARSGIGAQPLLPALVAGEYQRFYYSEHADKVFAVQAGQATVTWVSKRPVTINGTTAYDFKTETFGVTSSTKVPVRQMFWTEKSFNAPAVAIPSGIVQVAKPIYTSSFPATVATEYPSVGTVNPDYNAPSELRTVWFESVGGTPTLRAYNREGRIFVEYLGELVEGSTTKRRFIGADIVDVFQVPPISFVTTYLGDRILPPGGDTSLQASPVQSGSVVGFFASAADANGKILYYAERENLVPDRVSFYWLEAADAAIEKNPSSPLLALAWPKSLSKNLLLWPDTDPAAGKFVQVTSGEDGFSGADGLQFDPSNLPTVIFQDDPSQSQAAFDSSTQRLGINLSGDSTGSNLALLKFVSGSSVWYVRLHTQVAGRPGYQETDAQPAINQTATVGDRINPPQGYLSGVIESGTGYLPAAYINPVTSGPQAAAQGAIIPVNSVPGNDTLRVRWFRRIQAPTGFYSFFVPSKLATYTLRYPVNPAKIVIASNQGSGDLTASQAAGSIYYQNNPALPGYNPNEEHALVIAGRAYALRDDLNLTGQTSSSYSSEPFVILSYTAADGLPAAQVWKVLREDEAHKLNYTATAGTVLQAPMPLPILPPNASNREVTASNVDPAPAPGLTTASSTSALFSHYDKFTFTDRTGRAWLYRGPHASESSPEIAFQFFYTVLEGFHVPGVPVQPAVGSTLPFLRPLDQNGNPVGDAASAATTPQTIVYRPKWPDSSPSLALAETLTLPARALPAVRGQKSAQVLYQQSIAKSGASSPSVALHDPTRLKVLALNAASNLEKLPDSVITTTSSGRTYFQNLPPHLQNRFYFDPSFPSAERLGALVLKGEFVPSATGENYLNLNVLSTKDVAALKDLCGTGNPTQKTRWDAAVTALSTTLETWVEDPAKKGTYKLVSNKESPSGHNALAHVTDPSTAVDSYALSATGGATGYVTLVFGNGNPKTTDPGDPVVVQIIKVVPELYQGDLKVLTASNPLSELVSLRHSGDYAGRPQDFEFEWRHTPALGSAPATYSRTFQPATTTSWRLLQNPSAAFLSNTNFGSVATLPRSVTIKDGAHSATLPGILLTPSEADLDFSAGVPERIVLSAALSSQYDGFVAYVNGVPAVAYQAPADFTSSQPQTGLLPNNAGLALQFYIPSAFFSATAGNTVQIALYSSADNLVDSTVDFQIHRSIETDLVAGNNSWSTPNGEIDNIAVVGGIPSAALSNPLLMVTDNWFTMRYRRKASAGGVQTGWSRWMAPVLVEGWAKRVLAAINPFNQRMTDLMSNAVNTDVSLVTQAGKRWEGDIPLSMDSVDNAGLIEIYETVLNRVKLFTLDSGIDYAPANDALLLSAGYLNDLYMILGNEAYADSVNPTIAISSGQVNTSRFAFEGQAANLLGEELCLLRGRDDFASPGTTVRPVYNRLYWNYTRGINSGEAIYALNYNITEKAGSSSADGIIDAADASRMFPQGHGDAYGHYLTALKNYIRLLSSPNFTWTPRVETVNVLGQPVAVDYKDERKFAQAAAALGRTSKQIAANTWRQLYSEDAADGWSHLRDGKFNSATGTARHQGLDEWISRGAQAAYYNWALANAILPDRETDPNKSGIQIIDRTTVPELDEIAGAANSLQTTADSASARLNPLGLSPGSIAFDISANDLLSGKSHYEQVQERALASLINAKGAFDQASRMSSSLRDGERDLDELNQSIVEQERAFVSSLKEIFGSPYTGDIGPGRSYPAGYDGPDNNHWFVIDRDIGAKFADTSKLVGTTYYVLSDDSFENFVDADKTIQGIKAIFDSSNSGTRRAELEAISVNIRPDSLSQLSDEYFSYAPGSRAVTGEIQFALAEARAAYLALQIVADDTKTKEKELRRVLTISRDLLNALDEQITKNTEHVETLKKDLEYIANMEFSAEQIELASDLMMGLAMSAKDGLPDSPLDIFTGAKTAVLATANAINYASRVVSSGLKFGATIRSNELKKKSADLDIELEKIGFNAERRQVLYDFMVLYDEYTGMMNDIARAAMDYARAMERARNAIAKGNEILAEREAFRKRAAAIVSGYRTQDFAFRTFRNEALEQYSTLFDIASRYTYLAAKAYDYETGLLGTTSGSKVFSGIVASRALGDLTGNIPRATTSTTGDSGLGGIMARLQSDWSVAKGRLGINNPDQNGTLFSLRRELFRIPNDPASEEDDTAWRQILEQHIVPDLLADRDIASSCRGLATADGSPVPGIVISFGSTITTGNNFFGLPLSGGDHAFSVASFATKIFSTGVVLRGYEGMDPVYAGRPGTTPTPATPNMLAATPYLYVIPVGYDKMQAPPLGNTGVIRSWSVADQALPLPFNLGATDFNTGSYFNASGTLTEKPWTIRMHQAFRPVDDPSYFYGGVPREFTNTRLVARSAWNTGWKIVIPANTLHENPQTGLDRFCASIDDIELFLRTYSHSGN